MKILQYSDIKSVSAGNGGLCFMNAFIITTILTFVGSACYTAFTRSPAQADLKNQNDAKLFAQYVAQYRNPCFPIYSQDQLR